MYTVPKIHFELFALFTKKKKLSKHKKARNIFLQAVGVNVHVTWPSGAIRVNMTTF